MITKKALLNKITELEEKNRVLIMALDAEIKKAKERTAMAEKQRLERKRQKRELMKEIYRLKDGNGDEI